MGFGRKMRRPGNTILEDMGEEVDAKPFFYVDMEWFWGDRLRVRRVRKNFFYVGMSPFFSR